MLDRRILGLIELSAAGITNGQLLWRLNTGGTRYDASQLLAALENLAQAGSIRRDGARWWPARQSGTSAKEAVSRRGASTGQVDVLQAAPASLGATPPEPPPSVLGEQDALPVFPNPAMLLRYYAATQRRDPRGAVEAFPDGHGLKWRLFDCRGRWWAGAEIAIRSALLGGGFLQAVAEAGPEGTGAVGWPIGVFRGLAGIECIPALLFPASWRLEDERLLMSVDAVQPALNPAFVRHVKRLTRLGEDALMRTLEPGEEDASLEVVCRRFGHLLAKIGGQGLRPGELLTEVSLVGEGVRNAAALFLSDESSFTRRVAEDLDKIADWPEERRSGTALHALLSPSADQPANTSTRLNVVEIEPLTERQFLAADAALSGAITAIQGPPGTGKSQTIVALLASALAEGGSVIFVARNHRALDEVERRLLELVPGSVAMVRARDADGERDTSMFDVLVELANGSAAHGEVAEAVGDRRNLLLEAASARAVAFRTEAERTSYHLALADLVEREEDLDRAYAAAGASPQRRRWHGLLACLRGLFRRNLDDVHSVLPRNARPEEVRRRIAGLRSKLSTLPAPSDPPLPAVRKHLPPLVHDREVPDAETLKHLRSRKSDIEFMRSGSRMRHLTAEDASILLRHRPVWAASTLSVPARIPLAPALFELAIFDEASQCDIASALPILARAKRAVIVGDPEQLSFIPSLGKAQEHALMDAAGLPKGGRGAWAQSRNSLFDFVRARIGVDRLHLLPDQFRSAPAIVDYTSETFYGGRLRARRDDDDFRAPHGYRPGLHWEDVQGTCAREDGGNINRAEAEWIAQRIANLAGDSGFEGSVGIISPFTAQVALIRRLVEQAVSPEARARLRLGIDTVDAWQGGEADVIFISLAVGANAAHSAVSFLSKERRRLNVAVSRAKAVATVVGDLAWARNCGIAHVEILAERATRPATTSRLGFDSRWERRVHEALASRGLNPMPQYPLGRRSLDFALFNGNVRLDLEIDGRKWHTGAGGERKMADRLRDRELIAKGWKVRRFWVDELAADMEGCLDIVERDLGLRA